MTKSHGNHGKKVHRPCSSCISSIGNLIGTSLSSPCQLELGGWLKLSQAKSLHKVTIGYWVLMLSVDSECP